MKHLHTYKEFLFESTISEMKITSVGVKEILKKLYDDAKLTKALHFKNFRDALDSILGYSQTELEELETEIKELEHA